MGTKLNKIVKRFRNPSIIFQDMRFFWSLSKGYAYKARYGLNKKISIGKKFRVMKSFKIEGSGVVVIGDNVTIHDYSHIISAKPTAYIKIGNDVILNGAKIYAWKEIVIGNLSMLAYCEISDTDSHSIQIDRRTNPNAPIKVAPVYIKDNVWIGKRSLIFKGITVGKNSVIGAGSIVTKDIPKNCFFAGNPAKFIKKITE